LLKKEAVSFKIVDRTVGFHKVVADLRDIVDYDEPDVLNISSRVKVHENSLILVQVVGLMQNNLVFYVFISHWNCCLMHLSEFSIVTEKVVFHFDESLLI
jgi:hypothetical protein